MALFTAEDIRKAREMDLLAYLQYYEPDNLKRVSGNVFCTVEHDSLVISNGKWCWFSQGIGGVSALDYLVRVKNIPFREAVKKLTGASPPVTRIKPVVKSKGEFVMPELSESTWRTESYLRKRGIDSEIIRYCITNGLIFETADYHNVLFVGYDQDNKPRYGALRSTWSDFKGDARDSDKRYSFKLFGNKDAKTVHVFESAPDLLSYATILKMEGLDWKSQVYLSLAGISDVGQSVPRALEKFLEDYQSFRTVHLHLDNDPPGRKATAVITRELEGRCVVFDVPPPEGKDFNDYLKLERARAKQKKTEVR